MVFPPKQPEPLRRVLSSVPKTPIFPIVRLSRNSKKTEPMRLILLRPSEPMYRESLRPERSGIIMKSVSRLVGLIMSLNENAKVQALADSPLISLMVKGLVPIVVVLLSIQLARSQDISVRLTALETTVHDKMDNAYPRPEAIQAFDTVNARIDGVVVVQQFNSHRLSALEDARNRPLH